MCFACLDEGHKSASCKFRLRCKICSRSHPISLHKFEDRRKYSSLASVDACEPQTADFSGDEAEAVVHAVKGHHAKWGTSRSPKVLSPVVPVLVKLKGASSGIRTYIVLDSWATECFMSEELMRALGANGSDRNLTLTTMGEKHRPVSTTLVDQLQIFSLDGLENCCLPKVYALSSNWPFEKEDSSDSSEVEKYELLKSIPFKFIPSTVGMLVGINAPDLLMPLEIVSGGCYEPYATRHCAYVDDVTTSLPNEYEAIVVLRELREIAASVAFNLTSVISNSRIVLASVPKDNLAKDIKELNLSKDELPENQALGVIWDVGNEMFQVKVNLGPHKPTRRNMLSTICGIFDPLGLAAPAIVPA